VPVLAKEDPFAAPPPTTMTTETNTSELKRLGFVVDYSAKATETATKLYASAKSAAPSSLAPAVENLEGAIMAYGKPLLEKGAIMAPKMLEEADKRVDVAVGVYESYASSDNVKAFKQTREEYLKQIEAVLEELKAKGVQGSVKFAVENLNASLEEVKKYAKTIQISEIPKSVMERVNTYWGKLAAHPSVSALIQQSVDKVELAKAEYIKAHEKVVKSAYYKKAFDSATPYVSKVQDSSYFKMAMDTAAPYVTKAKEYEIVNTWIDWGTPIVKASIEHFKPIVA